MSVSAVPAPPPMDAPENALGDGVVSLTPIVPADAVTVMEWDADPQIQRWYDWPLTPRADDPDARAARLASAERTIESARAAWAAGTQFTFVIRSVESGEGLGWLDLQPRGSGRGNVAYGVVTRHCRKGAATRSVRLACRYAFDVIGWFRLDLVTIADNAASRAVALKAGFQLEGVMRSYAAYERHQPVLGQRYDWAIYGRLRADA